MRLHTLILALLAIGARAATIPDKTEVEKKLTEVIKEVLNKDEMIQEKVDSEQKVIDEANGVKDVENNLRNRVPIVDIPVKVVVEDVKGSVRSDNEKDKDDNNEVTPEEEIKRPEIDLKNPGPPQRMQHDNQNPDRFEEHQPVLSGLKQSATDTQNVFINGPTNFQQNLQNWFEQNQQLVQIQQQIQQLQQNFQNQISVLNSTVQKFFKPEGNPSESLLTEAQNTVQSGLKMIEDNVKSSVKSLTDGVQAITSAKESSNNASGGFPGFGSGSPWNTIFQSIQTQMTQGFQNLTNNLQNYFNSTQTLNVNNSSGPTNFFQNWSQGVQNLIGQGQQSSQSGTAQSDETQTQRPTIWQNIQSIFNPPGSQQPPNDPVAQPQTTPNRPIANAIQGVVSFIQPGKKPENPPAAAPQEGSNVVPAVPVKPEEQKEKPVEYVESGPIKQLIEKNPIVQGLAGAVQRIQHTIKPEKPRDTVKNSEKGHLFKPTVQNKGHGNGGVNGSASGDNNYDGSGVAAKNESTQKEEVPPKKCDKEAVKPSEEEKKPDMVEKAKKD